MFLQFLPYSCIAQFQGNAETVKLLLEKGALIDENNDAGDSALLLAASENQVNSTSFYIRLEVLSSMLKLTFFDK